MDLTQLFDLKAEFGWAQGIAILALIVAISTWWNQRRARVQLLPKIDATISYEGFDSRRFQDGLGTLIYWWAIDLVNTGGRASTCRGLRTQDSNRSLVAGLRDNPDGTSGAFSAEGVSAIWYFPTKSFFDNLLKDTTSLDTERPNSWPELTALNITVPPGEVRSIFLVSKIFVQETPVNGIMFNVQLVFSQGNPLILSKAVFVRGGSAFQDAPY